MIAPLLLSGLSALGGIFGKKRKYMDPFMYNQMFGARAIGKRTQEIVNEIANSPYGQQLMQQAAEQGQQLQTNLNRAQATAGFGPAGGAQSGASDFGVAAAPQAVGALQRGVTAGFTEKAMPIAQQLVANEGQLHLNNLQAENEEPSMLGKLGGAAATALSGMSGGNYGDWMKSLTEKKPKTAAVA